MGFSGPPSEPDVATLAASGSPCAHANGIRPLVQLRLHREYSRPGLDEAGPRSAGIHQRSPRRASALRTHWTPLPCTRLSRARTTTGPPPHFAGVNRRQVFPAMMAGADEVVPTFTPRTYQRGRCPAMPLQLRHGYAAVFHRGLPAGDITRPRSSPTGWPGRMCVATQPRSVRFELVVFA